MRHPEAPRFHQRGEGSPAPRPPRGPKSHADFTRRAAAIPAHSAESKKTVVLRMTSWFR